MNGLLFQTCFSIVSYIMTIYSQLGLPTVPACPGQFGIDVWRSMSSTRLRLSRNLPATMRSNIQGHASKSASRKTENECNSRGYLCN